MKIGLFALFDNFKDSMGEAIKDQLELSLLADSLGFDEIWLGEHHLNTFSVVPDPITLMSYIAAKTKHIKIGSAGFLAPYYHPIRLAESLAMLDVLSGGRLNIGFAKGGFAPDSRVFLQNKEDLQALMLETIEVVNLLLKGEKVSFKGRFLDITNSFITPKPLQKTIPTYIATFSSPTSIKYAAKHGYGLMMSQGASLDECVAAQELYKSISGFEPEMVVMRVLYIDSSYGSAKQSVMPVIDYFVKCMRASGAELVQPSFNLVEQTRLIKEREEFFVAHKFLDNAILGTPQECAIELDKFSKEIKNLHIGLKPSSSDVLKNKEMLEVFVKEVKPKLKKGGG
ncbi:MAG: LLM class flavin-dependent oxidoreductase [Sulfurimonadaceae bacterium]|jgi:alkanesulfonate monooxygenase SsuD/methylene tetrahydromethanopterin reductase-like flavin-dependent oxidoreductase (luciferase family)|nr:LLM class flavin-dependent oxidoreductase [Sulfurimonadaceae bacterium]